MKNFHRRFSRFILAAGLLLAVTPALQALPKIKVLATGGTIAGAQATQADAGYKSGTFSVDDLIMAVPQLKNLAELREEQLRLLIGATDAEPLAIGEDIRLELAVPNTSGKLDDLIAEAKQKRLDFKTLDLGILAKEKQRQSEDASLYPRLSAFGTADYANPNQRVFPQENKFTFTWAAGLQLTWTINDKLNAMTTDRRLRAETD